MTLSEFITHLKKAITTNYKCRNVSVASAARMKQIKSQRRATIRNFILQLRLATNDDTKEFVTQKVNWLIG